MRGRRMGQLSFDRYEVSVMQEEWVLKKCPPPPPVHACGSRRWAVFSSEVLLSQLSLKSFLETQASTNPPTENCSVLPPGFQGLSAPHGLGEGLPDSAGSSPSPAKGSVPA